MNVVAPSLTLVKRIKASPERVWAAWTQPAQMLRWFGPHHTRAEQAEADLREGGRFRVALREDNGARHEATGSYLEIEEWKRLVFSWHWVSTPERVSRVTVVLRSVTDGTEVTLTHDRFADADTATRHTRGWTESLERLGALLEDAG
jgi:uncharacterized protein YndB with AHSA1/START domain